MDKKKMEIAAAVALVMVFIFLLSGSVKKIAARFSAAKPQTPQAAHVPGAEARPLFESKKEVKIETDEPGSITERDPFSFPEMKQVTPGLDASDMKLTGISTNGKGKAMAIINDKMVSEGGAVGKYTVVKIAGNKVIITNGQKNFELKLK